ncbi:MAG TPA: ferritin-like domain-containing protein [Methyloceanibacter sp.]|nr:ferritin-like domain-containing protein [Methyloceanibacter sp.]
MLMELETLRDLYLHELRDLRSAESQITKALPKMIKAATSEDLSQALSEHLVVTKEHVARLDRIFAELNASSRGKKCKCMEGLLEEGAELLEEEVDPEVLDAGIIAAAQRVEHYEIAGYGTARAYAALLGDALGENLLEQTAREEGDADKTLTAIAQACVNLSAINGEPAALPASRSLARGSGPRASRKR